MTLVPEDLTLTCPEAVESPAPRTAHTSQPTNGDLAKVLHSKLNRMVDRFLPKPQPQTEVWRE